MLSTPVSTLQTGWHSHFRMSYWLGSHQLHLPLVTLSSTSVPAEGAQLFGLDQAKFQLTGQDLGEICIRNFGNFKKSLYIQTISGSLDPHDLHY